MTVQGVDDIDVRWPAAAAGAAAAVDGQLHFLVRLVAGAVLGTGQPRPFQGDQAAVGDPAQLVGGRAHRSRLADRERDQRQVLRQREQAVGLQQLRRAEALGAAQQHAGGEPAALEEVEHSLREVAAAVAVVLAEVEAELERVAARGRAAPRRFRAAHSTPPSQCPNVTAANPAASERAMLSHSVRAAPASPRRWDSNIQVEKVV